MRPTQSRAPLPSCRSIAPCTIARRPQVDGGGSTAYSGRVLVEHLVDAISSAHLPRTSAHEPTASKRVECIAMASSSELCRHTATTRSLHRARPLRTVTRAVAQELRSATSRPRRLAPTGARGFPRRPRALGATCVPHRQRERTKCPSSIASPCSTRQSCSCEPSLGCGDRSVPIASIAARASHPRRTLRHGERSTLPRSRCQGQLELVQIRSVCLMPTSLDCHRRPLTWASARDESSRVSPSAVPGRAVSSASEAAASMRPAPWHSGGGHVGRLRTIVRVRACMTNAPRRRRIRAAVPRTCPDSDQKQLDTVPGEPEGALCVIGTIAAIAKRSRRKLSRSASSRDVTMCPALDRLQSCAQPRGLEIDEVQTCVGA